MSNSSTEKITLFTSRWCAHSLSVERFLDSNEIVVQKINIDGDNESRQRLIEINGGYASVPTLIFPDGTKLTEPSLSQLRNKLQLDQPSGLANRIQSLLGRRGQIKKS